ncbi:ABC-three component system protein [Enterococcus ureasiticus]|uniref:CD-NTase associated protein 4-like DNA endonuclease domain-containing protein n=1 Tax=Enterococcus ureasiticus TaxID=903984 RepID=A0A1E5GHK2_9ENTE|nr:ABC-three component system protein [Enterococcus ureasiticus]OEG12159.1 hypothetical protein BCR21_07945 [Enterococcus ureasiticus]
MSSRSTQEKMAADDKIIAFDFQFHYFLLQLFSLKTNESAGFEYKEDVHIDHSDGYSTYIQVKHTAIGQNITDKDEALWKTIWSWLNIIQDKDCGGKSLSGQLDFIGRTNFLLITNKHDNQSNSVLKSLSNFKSGSITLEQVIQNLKILIKDEENQSETERRITKILEQEKSLLDVFFRSIEFSTDFSDIDQQIKKRLTEIYVPEKLQTGMLEAIYYRVKHNLYEVVMKKEHLSYSQKEFSDIVNRYNHAPYLNRMPVYQNFDIANEEKPSSDMLFIKQLEDIEELDLNDDREEEYVLKLYENKLLYENNRMRWIQESELPEMDIKEIEDQAEEIWIDEFHKRYRKHRKKKLDKESVKDTARELFYEVKKTELEFSMDVSSSRKLGEGVFLYLSDVPTIGWHYDWKEKYSNANIQ